MDDYLALGGLLEGYVANGMAGSPVKQLTAMGEIENIALRGHLICIAFAGESVAISHSPDTAVIVQRWLTIVSVQTTGKALDATVPLAKAGPLLWRLGKLVQGQQFPGYKPLVRVTPPPPRLLDNFAHFPLAWETSFIFVGDGQIMS